MNKLEELLKEERMRVYKELLKTGRLSEVELFIVDGNLMSQKQQKAK